MKELFYLSMREQTQPVTAMGGSARLVLSKLWYIDRRVHCC